VNWRVVEAAAALESVSGSGECCVELVDGRETASGRGWSSQKVTVQGRVAACRLVGIGLIRDYRLWSVSGQAVD